MVLKIDFWLFHVCTCVPTQACTHAHTHHMHIIIHIHMYTHTCTYHTHHTHMHTHACTHTHLLSQSWNPSLCLFLCHMGALTPKPEPSTALRCLLNTGYFTQVLKLKQITDANPNRIIKTKWNFEKVSTNEQIMEMWSLNIMKFYPAVKNEIMKCAGKWMAVEIIILKQIAWTQIGKCHVVSFLCRC